MKKIIYFISVLLTCTCLNKNVQAFIWPDLTPLIPFSPQFCVMCIPPAIDWAYNTVDQIKGVKDRLKEMTDVTKIKQKLTSYAVNLGNTALNSAMMKLSAKKKVASASRTIMESKREGVDIRSEDSIKVDFVNLFLQYPSTKSKIKSAYKKKGENIKTDMSLEMYITASEMFKELCGKNGKGCEIAASIGDDPNAIDASADMSGGKGNDERGMMLQIAMVESCIMEGKYCGMIGMAGCEPSKDGESKPSGEQPTEADSGDEDKVCHWKAALDVAMIYDKIMRYNEYLIQMQHQYEAVRTIENTAKIKAAKEDEKDKKTDEEAFLNDKYLPQNNYFAQSSTSVAFASAGDEDDDLTEEDLEEFSKYEKSMENKENIMGGEFEELKKAEGYESELDGKEDDFASLAVLEEVQKSIDEAKNFHNMKQMLPDFKKTFQELKDAREYHDKTVEYLQESSECAVGYLTPHYKKAAKVWFGGDCDFFGPGTIYCHYNPEKKPGDESASVGLYDDYCPNDDKHLCYIQKVEENEYNMGVAGLLLGYYNEGKDADALQETSTYLKEGEKAPETQVEKTGDNAYTAQVEVIGDTGEDSVDKDVYVTGRSDPKHMDADNENASDIVPSMSSAKNATANEQNADENTKDPKKAEALEEESRKGHLMNWIWGAQVSADIARDLDSQHAKLGDRVKRFPLWTDQKEFYDQYIDGKYDNIASYVQKAPMPNAILTAAIKINDVFEYAPIVITDALGNEKLKIEADTIKETIAGALSDLEIEENADKTKETIDGLIENENKTLAAIKTKHEKKMAQLYDLRDKLQDQLSKVNSDLSDANEESNKDSGTVASQVNTDRASAENDKYSKEVKSLYKTPIDVEQSPINKKIASDKEESDTAGDKAKTDRATKIKTAEAKEAMSKAISDKLKEVKEKIEAERVGYIEEYSEAEEKLRLEFIEKAESVAGEVEEQNANTVSDAAIVEKITEAINKAAEKLSSEYNEEIALPLDAASLSGEMITCLREEAAKIAIKTKEGLDKLKGNEELYVNYDKVAGAHSNMIDEMKNISSCSVEGVKSEIIAEEVFGKMCDDVKCLSASSAKDSQGLTQYFVGEIALKEDMKVPTSPVEFSSAPVREIFHFDLTDYDNLEKAYKDPENLENNADIVITADSFLNSGLEMPLIWRYILRRHTYGHKQFDLTRLLGNVEFGDNVRGDPDKSYIRSGTFPCYIDGNVIDANPMVKLVRIGFKWVLVVEKFGYTINKTSDAYLYGKVPCKGLSIRDGKVIDYAVDASPPGDLPAEGVKGLITDTSELGSVLAYVPRIDTGSLLEQLLHGGIDKNKVTRKLTFNASLQKAVGIISKTEDLEDNKEQEAVFHLANRSLFDRNQFGDFLNQMEQEALARESLMKVENQIDEIIKNLQSIFYGTEVVISDDFDLLNEEDYKQAADALDEQKGIYMNKAQTEITKVKGFTETVKNRSEKLLHSLAVLSADSDELVQINGDEDISELADKVKNKAADNAVANEYDKENASAQEHRLRQLQPPYCEVHPYNVPHN